MQSYRFHAVLEVVEPRLKISDTVVTAVEPANNNELFSRHSSKIIIGKTRDNPWDST